MNGWNDSAIRAKIVADLGLDPDADDDAIVQHVKDLRFKAKVAAMLDITTVSPADKTFWDVALERVEAAKARVKEVRLTAADRQAIDATVAASSDPHADLRERAVLDVLGLPTARTPEPVLLRKGTSPADYTTEQQYQDFAHKLGGPIAVGVPRPPAGDVYYQPSPNDPYEFVNGQWREKNPYKEI